ncbi:type I restriction-modification system subunit M [Mesomycoplasma hyorhinis]|uniref:type I restriction-modification system subunit M n=1 Tax=Mesomycoplasma hyorhinis TaxID=2100 RepID=UPI001C04C378|nr:type I restriction-modification system subunit M [Mesomycoplasma hyorhinis]
MSKKKNTQIETNKTLTKQELGNKIWEAANEMRGSLEITEYKNFLLELIFYKTISQRFEEWFLKYNGNIEDIQWLNDDYYEDNSSIKSPYSKNEYEEIKESANKNLGYFIQHQYLYSSWMKDNARNFSASLLNRSINSFDSNLRGKSENLFENIFKTLSDELYKLSTNEAEQTKKLKKLIEIIKDIPVKKGQYDILGFAYEYLIGKFASSAGKKGGEFYTPHEISLLMAEIVAFHLKHKDNIKIYDPTSGSGSLLLNIGEVFQKFNKKKHSVTYYAQEINESTYKLTKMNLILHGVNVSEIHARNADTLKQDWPIDKINSTEPLRVDSVVSNPPYSLKWDTENAESDKRFRSYAVAPKAKADFAFLLHDLYHISPDGIVAIVLPHGVLFRGGNEKIIRERLIENAEIDSIIGLPSDIFYGTSISTIIVILKRKTNDEKNQILFVDASKLFVKEGKKNKLEISHIKKIADTVNNKIELKDFSRLVDVSEIRENDYNLNISRYLDNFKKEEKFDLYSTIYGNISETELDEFNEFFTKFLDIKNQLLKPTEKQGYYLFKDPENIQETIFNSSSVQSYLNSYDALGKRIYNLFKTNFSNWDALKTLNKIELEKLIINFVFNQLEEISFLDKYDIFQILMNSSLVINNYLEYFEFNKFSDKTDEKILDFIKSTAQIIEKERIVSKKTKLKETVIVKELESWDHEIIHPDMISSIFLADKLKQRQEYEEQINQIVDEIESIVESISDEDKTDMYFDFKEKDDVWKISIQKIKKEAKKLKSEQIEDNSLESWILQIDELENNRKNINNLIKDLNQELILQTYNTFKTLTNEQVIEILISNWTNPIINDLKSKSKKIILDFVFRFENLHKKYEDVLENINSEIKENEANLATLLTELDANQSDSIAINKLIKILK